MADQFVNLHRHDSFSFWDGMDVAARAAQRAKDLGQPALALTNHGNVFGIVDHYRACAERGVKGIMGIEAYVTPSAAKPDKEKGEKLAHQTILFADNAGYRNAMRLITESYDDDLFYYKPRMTMPMLAERGDGLVILSGCPSSIVQRYLLAGDADRAEAVFRWFAGEFRGRYYAELQQNEQAKQTAPALVALAKKYRVPLVATNDAHYVDPEDKVVHDLLLKMKKKDSGEEDPTYGYGFHVASRQDMCNMLVAAHPWLADADVVAALDSTVEIAERCSVTFEKPKRMLPALWDNPVQLLKYRAGEGMIQKGIVSRAYEDRLEYELKVVIDLGYAEYFHICFETCEWARREGILIGPRGSVCSSLLAYVLGITLVDPIRHGTMFERFLHEQKKSFPDVDLDIDSRRHGEVLAHVLEAYKPYAIPIATFGRYGEGNVANDMMRVFPDAISKGEKREIRSALSEIKEQRAPLVTFEDLEKYPVFGDVGERVPDFPRIVLKLYNMVRYMGKHPGGVCFVPDDHTRWMAKTVDRKGNVTTSYSFLDTEYLGLLKLDFLGVRAMGTIANTIRLARDRLGEDVSLGEIPLDDVGCYQQFSAGNTDGIFQFETRHARQILRDIEPDRFDEVAAATSINRPGVSASLEKYVRNKTGRWGADIDPEDGPLSRTFKDALSPTYGCIIYQEQILTLLRAFGLEWKDCDEFLKSIKPQQGYAAGVIAQKGRVVRGSLAGILVGMGLDQGSADTFVDRITRYSFNKCVSGDTIVHRSGAGRYAPSPLITVADLHKNFAGKENVGKKYRSRGVQILQMDADGRIRPGKVVGVYDNGEADVVRFVTSGGKSIKVTTTHRLLTSLGYVEARSIGVGDFLVCEGIEAKVDGRAGRGWRKGHRGGAGEQKDGRTIFLREAKLVVRERSGWRCESCGNPLGHGKHDHEYAHVASLASLHGDYSRYHSEANIWLLCNSCHKQLDWDKGERKRRWSKGRPTSLEAIVIKRRCGRERVYDIEMGTDEHNFLASGIVSHNSHAVGYSLVAYWMMWLRLHYPLEFWCSLLTLEPHDEMRAAYESAAIVDGCILLPPHVNGTWDYSVEENAIRVGLRGIAGVGEKSAQAIVANQPYGKAEDILKVPRRQCNAAVIKALVGAGALEFRMARWEKHCVDFNVAKQQANRGLILMGWARKGEQQWRQENA